jgi:UrcA family protein
MSNSFTIVVATGLLATAAQAQNSSYYDRVTYGPPSETVTVLPPSAYRVDRNGFNAPSKIALRQDVTYSDLDLKTAIGATELRTRVRTAAATVCNQLLATYPVPQVEGTDCYASTTRDALARAETVIRHARGTLY